MKNMTNAVTNEKTVLEKLVVTNTNQVTPIVTLSTTIHTLSIEVKQLQLNLANIDFKDGKSYGVRKCLKDVYC